MKIELADADITEDEPCLSLWEGNLMSKVPGENWHRYQILRVIRNDRPEEFRQDLGPASKFTADPFFYPGGVVHCLNGAIVAVPLKIDYRDIWKIEVLHTVGELRAMADVDRGKPPWTAQIEPTPLSEIYYESQEYAWHKRLANKRTLEELIRIEYDKLKMSVL